MLIYFWEWTINENIWLRVKICWSMVEVDLKWIHMSVTLENFQQCTDSDLKAYNMKPCVKWKGQHVSYYVFVFLDVWFYVSMSMFLVDG